MMYWIKKERIKKERKGGRERVQAIYCDSYENRSEAWASIGFYPIRFLWVSISPSFAFLSIQRFIAYRIDWMQARHSAVFSVLLLLPLLYCSRRCVSRFFLPVCSFHLNCCVIHCILLHLKIHRSVAMNYMSTIYAVINSACMYSTLYNGHSVCLC